MGIMEQKRKEMKKEFLALTPLERISQMNALFNDIISLKAKARGVNEYEVYKRYIKPHKLRPRKVKPEKEDENLLIS